VRTLWLTRGKQVLARCLCVQCQTSGCSARRSRSLRPVQWSRLLCRCSPRRVRLLLGG